MREIEDVFTPRIVEYIIPFSSHGFSMPESYAILNYWLGPTTIPPDFLHERLKQDLIFATESVKSTVPHSVQCGFGPLTRTNNYTKI